MKRDQDLDKCLAMCATILMWVYETVKSWSYWVTFGKCWPIARILVWFCLSLQLLVVVGKPVWEELTFTDLVRGETRGVVSSCNITYRNCPSLIPGLAKIRRANEYASNAMQVLGNNARTVICQVENETNSLHRCNKKLLLGHVVFS